MLVDGEENLGNLGFGVNFKFLFYVVGFAYEGNGAGGDVFDDVGFSRNRQAKPQRGLGVVFFLFFELGVYVKKQSLS